MLHDGSRRADPGEQRYTAPFWVPEDVRRAHHVPAVLFTDPWFHSDDPALRRYHARMCMDEILAAGRPVTAEEVQASLSQRHARQDPAHAAQGPPPPATVAYVKQLLEHMRRSRLLYGKKNPVSALSPGHPEHPRLYVPLPYQAARYGNPEQLAAEDAAAKEKAVQHAYKRLRNGKSPYPIFRRRARFSLWQHEQAQEALRGWAAQAAQAAAQ